LASKEQAADLQLRYALYLSSLRKTNLRIPSGVLDLCLQEQILTWRQEIDSARLHLDYVARARAISSVLPSLPKEECERTVDAEFEVAAGLDDASERCSADLAFATLRSCLAG
jgi:hypothetical protein